MRIHRNGGAARGGLDSLLGEKQLPVGTEGRDDCDFEGVSSQGEAVQIVIGRRGERLLEVVPAASPMTSAL